jgi:SAM-dependent methyltransferase
MDSYGDEFAYAYDLLWSAYARSVSPAVYAFYMQTPAGQAVQPILDLCCGTGQLALYLLERGCRVTGLDISEPMLGYAREHTRAYIETGQARFVQGDATDFRLDERFGFVISTYNALNHLESDAALRKCFRCVHDALLDGGGFAFDMKTRLGLSHWNHLSVQDAGKTLVVSRGLHDGISQQAATKLTTFIQQDDGRYVRIDETLRNTIYDMDAVKTALLDTGWQNITFALPSDLGKPIDTPETHDRVFIVAWK